MTITGEMIDKFVEVLAEESKQYNNGEISYPYITGVLTSQLKWALSGDLDRKIVAKGILQAVVEDVACSN